GSPQDLVVDGADLRRRATSAWRRLIGEQDREHRDSGCRPQGACHPRPFRVDADSTVCRAETAQPRRWIDAFSATDARWYTAGLKAWSTGCRLKACTTGYRREGLRCRLRRFDGGAYVDET